MKIGTVVAVCTLFATIRAGKKEDAAKVDLLVSSKKNLCDKLTEESKYSNKTLAWTVKACKKYAPKCLEDKGKDAKNC